MALKAVGESFLATCITITPGTITVDFNLNDIFTIHALRQRWIISILLEDCQRNQRVRKITAGGKTHVVDFDSLYDFGIIRPA